MILEQPDVDRYADAFCGQQAGDDAETKAVADVGEDDHGHGDEVEVGDQIEGKETGVAESRKHSNREEGEANYDRCGEEDALPRKNCDFKDFQSRQFFAKLLPAVLMKEVEGADGTEDFCQTGKKEDKLMKCLEFTKIIYLVIQDV